MNWLQKLMHKLFGRQYIAWCLSSGELRIMRARSLCGVYYIRTPGPEPSSIYLTRERMADNVPALVMAVEESRGRYQLESRCPVWAPLTPTVAAVVCMMPDPPPREKDEFSVHTGRISTSPNIVLNPGQFMGGGLIGQAMNPQQAQALKYAAKPAPKP